MANLDDFKSKTSEQPKGFPALLDAYKGEVARALPEHLRSNIDRYTRLALTCFRLNPKLAECDPRSVFAAVILSSQLGLELGVMGHAYLVPYKGEATFVPGWRGYVDLVHRAGRAVCWTGAVFEGDDFEYAMGDSPYVKHKPHGEDDVALLTHTYAVGRVKGLEWPIVEVFSRAKIDKHLKRYNRVGERHYAHQNFEMYARKIALLQVVKYLPASVEIGQLVALEGAADSSRSVDLRDAIEGTVLTPYEEPKAEGQLAAPALTPAEIEETFALADDAARSKDFKQARALAAKLPEAKRKMILDKCPPMEQ